MDGKLIYTHDCGRIYQISDQADGGYCYAARSIDDALVISRDWKTIRDIIENIDESLLPVELEPAFFVACIMKRTEPKKLAPMLDVGVPLPKIVKTRDEAEASCDNLHDWILDKNGDPELTTMIFEDEFPHVVEL